MYEKSGLSAKFAANIELWLFELYINWIIGLFHLQPGTLRQALYLFMLNRNGEMCSSSVTASIKALLLFCYAMKHNLLRTYWVVQDWWWSIYRTRRRACADGNNVAIHRVSIPLLILPLRRTFKRSLSRTASRRLCLHLRKILLDYSKSVCLLAMNHEL